MWKKIWIPKHIKEYFEDVNQNECFQGYILLCIFFFGEADLFYAYLLCPNETTEDFHYDSLTLLQRIIRSFQISQISKGFYNYEY